jgi:hypothetical protein
VKKRRRARQHTRACDGVERFVLATRDGNLLIARLIGGGVVLLLMLRLPRPPWGKAQWRRRRRALRHAPQGARHAPRDGAVSVGGGGGPRWFRRAVGACAPSERRVDEDDMR